jgi:hypothetical protein
LNDRLRIPNEAPFQSFAPPWSCVSKTHEPPSQTHIAATAVDAHERNAAAQLEGSAPSLPRREGPLRQGGSPTAGTHIAARLLMPTNGMPPRSWREALRRFRGGKVHSPKADLPPREGGGVDHKPATPKVLKPVAPGRPALWLPGVTDKKRPRSDASSQAGDSRLCPAVAPQSRDLRCNGDHPRADPRSQSPQILHCFTSPAFAAANAGSTPGRLTNGMQFMDSHSGGPTPHRSFDPTPLILQLSRQQHR